MPPKKKETVAPKSPKTPKGQTKKEVKPKKDSGKKVQAPKKASKSTTVTKPEVTPLNVLLYLPNLIGYVRVICMFAFFFLSQSEKQAKLKFKSLFYWQIAIIFYFVGFFLDLVDGWAARKFNQSTLYGATLDMVVDRVATAGLLCILSSLDPEKLFIYTTLIVLDIGSHWFHMASTVTQGHHKDAKVLEERNYVLRLYYGVKWIFASCCVGQEFYYIYQYVKVFSTDLGIFENIEFILLLLCMFKQVVNFFQLASAVMSFAVQDAKLKNKMKK